MKGFLLSAFVLFSHSSFALVPTRATTFQTNVEILKATSSQKVKIEAAQELIKAVIATDEFREAVINHTYGGKKTYVDNGGYTNEEIYEKILDGAESLNKIEDNEMDLEVETYYSFSSTVGYTYSNTPKIYMNTKFLDSYNATQVSRNMIHEWLHKLGFKHASSYSTSRDYSVPYAIGEIMGRIAKTVNGSGTVALTAPTNLALTLSSSQVTLKWAAAKSSAGISSYKIYRTLSGSTTAYLQATTTSLSYSQTTPTKNAKYYVKATDKNGKTINSATIDFTATAALAAPTGVTLTKGTTQVTLKWNAATSATSYKVYRRLSGSSTAYTQTTTTNLSFSQTKPTSSATYYVRSIDKNGNTMKSAEVSYTK